MNPELNDTCPHRHRFPDVDRCDALDMTVCVYELGETCELWEEIRKEWEEEL